MAYVFPGITPYIDRAADELGLDNEHKHRARSGWHVKSIADALAQLPDQAAKTPGAVPEVIDRLKSLRAGLAAQLMAVDEAIDEVEASVLGGPRTVRKAVEPPKPPRRNRKAKDAAPDLEPFQSDLSEIDDAE